MIGTSFKFISYSKHIALFCALCLFNVIVVAQGKSPIFLEHSGTLSFDQKQQADCQVLRNDVVFRQGNTRLFCDVANFYEQRNKIDAFGNIRIVQGDSLRIYGEILHYDGNTHMARIKGHVRVVHHNTVLETDSLDFDQANNIGYYYTGGRITDKENVLTSKKGDLSFKTNLFTFRENVHLDNKNLALRTEVLKYNSKQKIAYFSVPTNIWYNEKTKIYTENGWYNTNTDDCQLMKNSYVNHFGGKKLKADTIFYNKKTGKMIARQHVQLTDSVQKMLVRGRYGNFVQNGDDGLMRDSAYAVDFSGTDSLYLHADTLKTKGDSTYHKMRGIGNVRFFRADLQGKCDSVSYSTTDSILNMYERPVLWSDSAQICGEFIQLYQKNKKADMIWVKGWALVVSQVDSTHFNQIQGKTLKAYIKDNQVRKVKVEGNAIAVYHPRDNDGSLIGVNRAESSTLTTYLKNKKIERIVMIPASTGTMYPIDQVPDDKKYVSRYMWLDGIRPKNKMDIFTRYTVQDEKPKAKKKKNKK
ncbi:MAG: OstA-like protein [Paludibacteraceae bacterium]|nr:OstA-like protein [Paludibacteraceae bacterium]